MEYKPLKIMNHYIVHLLYNIVQQLTSIKNTILLVKQTKNSSLILSSLTDEKPAILRVISDVASWQRQEEKSLSLFSTWALPA